MKIRTLIFPLALLILISCNLKQEENYIAKVNDEMLTLEEFRANFSDQQWEKLSKDDKVTHLEDWIKLSLLAQEADKLELSTTAQVQTKLRNAEINIKANATISQAISSIKISEDDLFDYYKVHKSKYQKKQKQFKIQQIYVKEKSKLDSTLSDLASGTKFKDVAKKYSEERLGATGGYLGFMAKKDVDEAIWNKLESLDKWRYSTLKLEKGYYVVRYYDRREITVEKTFAEVKDEISKIVLQIKQKESYDKLIEELKFRAENISISY